MSKEISTDTQPRNGTSQGDIQVLLTIAIPTYKRFSWLTESLARLIPALASEIELLVVDNDPEKSAADIAHTSPHVRYIHEPLRGVVHARNRAVREARGEYLAFIDDDEIPSETWLQSVLDEIASGTDASFGKVVPRYLEPVPPGLDALLDDLYTRDLKMPDGADATSQWAHVGTGNSLFRVASCFQEEAPFSRRFNAGGGEDVNFVRALIARGIRLRWMPNAVVEELVPADRASLAYLRARKFSHGQQRVIFERGAGGLVGNARCVLWVGVGALQVIGHGANSIAQRLSGSPRYQESLVRMSGGMGKLFWWRSQSTRYA